MSNRTGAGATINPDNIKMFYATAVGVGVVFAASVTISSFGLYAVGLAQGLPPHVAWVTPVMVDVAILVFTMVALIQKRRGNRFARVFASVGVGMATLLSVALNFLHSYFEIGVATLEAATGTLVNTVAPLFIWVTTEMLVTLVTKQPPAPRQTAARAKAPARKKKVASDTRAKPPAAKKAAPAAPSSPSTPAVPDISRAVRPVSPPRPPREPVTVGDRR